MSGYRNARARRTAFGELRLFPLRSNPGVASLGSGGMLLAEHPPLRAVAVRTIAVGYDPVDALPQNKWRDAENTWRRKYIAPVAHAAIQADHSFYARDYTPQPSRGRDDGSYELSIHGHGFLSDDWIAGYDY